MKSLLNRGTRKFPEYIFKWEDFSHFENNSHVWTMFKEETVEDVLQPLVSGFIKGVHRNTEQKINLIKSDVIKAYMRLIIYDMVINGKVVKLPGNYGWMALVPRDKIRKNGRKIAMFYVIQSDKMNKHSKNNIKNFTHVHIRDIQLLRQANAMINHFPDKYHTIDSFNNYVYNSIEYYKNLMTI